eukprot:3751786-Rhodomonas_salina.1
MAANEESEAPAAVALQVLREALGEHGPVLTLDEAGLEEEVGQGGVAELTEACYEGCVSRLLARHEPRSRFLLLLAHHHPSRWAQ